MRIAVGALCALGAALTLALGGSAVSAQVPTCDFSTGGGYIYPEPATGAKGTFSAAGGCKNGSYWGHLQYKDKGADLTVQWTSITAYMVDTLSIHQNSNARLTCGTATTNLYGDVDFAVRTKDAGEPAFNDEFDIQLKKAAGIVVYSTFVVGGPHKLGGGTGGGGNIQLHKPNNSNTGLCPALGPSQEAPDVSVIKSTDTPVIAAEVRYEIVVHNAGPGTADNVTLHDGLPPGASGTLSWELVNPPAGCFIVGGQTLDCTLGSLAMNASVTIQVKATTTQPDCPDALVNFATVSSDNDPNTANNRSGDIAIAACIE